MQDRGVRQYRVEFVSREALPADTEWAFIEDEAGDVWLVIEREHVTPDILEDCWEALRLMA